MKKYLSVLLIAVMLFSFTSCSNEEESGKSIMDEMGKNIAEIDISSLEVKNKDNPFAEIKVKDYGTIIVELYPDVAPIAVANFVSLSSNGFYDGLIFHRIIRDFMIQGGDPKGTGGGGPGYTIKGEFKINGIENELSHRRGVISMARNSISYDSAGSQFFIMHKTNISLNGQYAAFGMTVSGLDIVDKIATVKTNANDKPLEDVVIESIMIDFNNYTPMSYRKMGE